MKVSLTAAASWAAGTWALAGTPSGSPALRPAPARIKAPITALRIAATVFIPSISVEVAISAKVEYFHHHTCLRRDEGASSRVYRHATRALAGLVTPDHCHPHDPAPHRNPLPYAAFRNR